MLRNLLLLALLGGSSLAILPFPELQAQFADLSRVVDPQLQEFRQENSVVRLDLIHWIVREIGNITLQMRRMTDETWTYIENHEDVDEICLIDLRAQMDYYVWIGEMDIMRCAEYMDYYMRYDSMNRFNPRIGFIQLENSRAIYRTVQALGRNQVLGNMGDTASELQEELDYYRNLWDGYQEILRDELKAMEPFGEDVQYTMYSWQTDVIHWHQQFMNWAIDGIDFYCGDWYKD